MLRWRAFGTTCRVRLDPRAAEWLASRLVRLRETGHTVVLTTHDLRRASDLADAALLLVRGRATGLPSELHRDAAALERAYVEGVSGARDVARVAS